MHLPELPINIGLNDKQRNEISESLSRLLADTYVLYIKTHNFHWNVTGPLFRTLHIMFEEQYLELFGAVDTIAERIRALGYPAPSGFSRYNQLSSITEETGVPHAHDMIRQLVQGHEVCTKTARDMVAIVEPANDQPTLELIAGRMQVHEKTAWMLRSLLG